MKTKVLFLVFCLSIGLAAAKAQSQNHKLMFNASVGLTPTFLKDNSKTEMLPLAFELQYRLASNFSLGAYWGQSISSGQGRPTAGSDVYQYTNNYQVFALRPTLHTSPWRKGEFFGGMYLGYSNSRVDQESLGGSRIGQISGENLLPKAYQGIFLSAFIGGRYHLNKRIALQGELGMGVTLLSGGISFKL